MKIDHSWTLFLDRDGVINKELPGDYVKRWDEFHFEPDVLLAMPELAKLFSRIIIITNQRGVGIGRMTEEDLISLHKKMIDEIVKAGGRIDDIFYCSDADRNSPLRKPRTAMALKAKEKYPEIDFSKTIMAGNSPSDMEFGRALGMVNVFIDDKKSRNGNMDASMDFVYLSLAEFTNSLVIANGRTN